MLSYIPHVCIHSINNMATHIVDIEVIGMRNIIITIILAVLMLTSLSPTVLADENYHGEDGEQPGIGVDIGPGESSAPDSPGDRVRFKEY